jgi:hypothetical protein
MIYLPSHRAVFIHNPKCAGTSLVIALERMFEERLQKFWGRSYQPALDTVRDLAHIKASELPTFLPDAPIDFTFGVVRDPYARFVSALKHFRTYSGGDKHLSPEAFAARYMNHALLRADWRLVHFAPQYTFFFAGQRCIVNLIGRMESMDGFLTTLSKRLGFDIYLAKENVGSDDAIELSDDLIATINHFYARDFALFGYPMRTPAPGAKVLGDRDAYHSFETLWPEERGLEAKEQTRID